MNIPSVSGDRNQLQSTDATVLRGGDDVGTVGVRKHRPTEVEELTESARRKVEEAKNRATGRGTILDSFA